MPPPSAPEVKTVQPALVGLNGRGKNIFLKEKKISSYFKDITYGSQNSGDYSHYSGSRSTFTVKGILGNKNISSYKSNHPEAPGVFEFLTCEVQSGAHNELSEEENCTAQLGGKFLNKTREL